MKFVSKLKNPFVIGAQGFVLGAILFSAAPAQQPVQETAPAASSQYQLPEA